MMNNYSENIKWDIDKKSDTPVSILGLCSEYVNSSRNIIFNKLSNNQVIEIEIEKIIPNTNINEPRIMLLSDVNFGQQIYWNQDRFTIANTGSYSIDFTPPCRVKAELINNMFFIYINEKLAYKVASYTSPALSVNGIRLQDSRTDMIVTGFRYKNFEK